MVEKNKIIELIHKLNSNEHTNKGYVELSINYNQIINFYNGSNIVLKDNVDNIINIINQSEDIKRFNLTVNIHEDTYNPELGFDMDRYNNNWHASRIISYSTNKTIKHDLYSLSKTVSLLHLPKKKSIKQIINISKEYIKTNDKLYKLLK